MERSGADVMIRAVMEELRMQRPINPAEFMVQFLQNKYIRKKIQFKMRPMHALVDEMDEELSSPEIERASYLVVPDSLKRKRRGI